MSKPRPNITHSTYKLVAMNSQVLLQGCAIIEYFATWFKVASKCSLLRLLNDLHVRDPRGTASTWPCIDTVAIRIPFWMTSRVGNSTIVSASAFAQILPLGQAATSFGADCAAFLSSSSLKLIRTYSRTEDTSWPYYIIGKIQIQCRKRSLFVFLTLKSFAAKSLPAKDRHPIKSLYSVQCIRHMWLSSICDVPVERSKIATYGWESRVL